MKFDHARMQEHLLLKISANFVTRYQPILRLQSTGHTKATMCRQTRNFLIVLSPNQFMKFICIYMITFKQSGTIICCISFSPGPCTYSVGLIAGCDQRFGSSQVSITAIIGMTFGD